MEELIEIYIYICIYNNWEINRNRDLQGCKFQGWIRCSFCYVYVRFGLTSLCRWFARRDMGKTFLLLLQAVGSNHVISIMMVISRDERMIQVMNRWFSRTYSASVPQEFFKLPLKPEIALAYYIPDDTSLMYHLMYVIGSWNAIQRKGRRDIS